MKKMKSIFYLFAAAFMMFSFSSCSDDEKTLSDDGGESNGQTDDSGYHFDIFMTIGQHGGMNRGDGTIVKSVSSLDAGQQIIDIKNDGVEFRSDEVTYSMEAITKGKYYYQIPTSNDRFTKLQVVGNSVKVVQEQPFVQNTYKVRSYTHAWLDDDVLLIMAANGDADKIIWTKLDSDDMRIIGEGILDLPLPEGAQVFNSSGILTYNGATGKLFYFYFAKDKSGRYGKATSNFLTAVINPATMAVESNKVNSMAQEMAGSAYGELLQSIVMYQNGDLYLAAFSDEDDMEKGHLLRIKKGQTDFDSSYEGYPDADGKLLTIQSLGNGKALAYARNDAAGTGIDDFSHYYTVIDLATGSRTRLSCHGTEIPYSAGRFAQRSVIVDGKAYIGVNTQESNPCIYIYDIATGNVEKGVEIAEGYYFDMVRLLEND